jgi:riboflavin biosynthesis pyrimidine reductase
MQAHIFFIYFLLQGTFEWTNGFCHVRKPALLAIRAIRRTSSHSTSSCRPNSLLLTWTSAFSDTTDADSAAKDESTSADDTSSTTTPNNLGVTGVTLKLAFDSENAVADLSKANERFTSPASLNLVHKLRRCSDAVLVGKHTVECDNCSLTVRRVPFLTNQTQPTRVIIDPRLSLLEVPGSIQKYALFSDGNPTLLYYSQGMEEDELVADSIPLLPDSVTLVPVEASNADGELALTLSTKAIISDLAERNIHHIMVEGGPVTARTFLRDQAVDRAIIIKADMTFSEPLPSMIDSDLLQRSGLQLLGTSESEGDVVEYWSRPKLPWPSSDFTKWP